ncbi:MAG: NADH-quinone oxidoreductase subunit A [Acinetobacter sp.]
MSAITPYDWAIIAFVIGVTFLCVFMLTVPLLLGGKSWGRAKQEQFESGVVGAGGARIRLSAKFYLVAIFFVVFDLEALYLYAYSTSVREVGWFGYTTVVVFVVELLIGLVYALSIGALNWSPHDRRKAAGILPKIGSPNMDIAEITRFNSIDELVRDPTGHIPAQSRVKDHRVQTTTKNATVITDKE